ncbi:MAG: acyl-CoA dehydrogenase family protein [Planctomycetota bacterium]|jgi:alkylation response protein AidB-like acyl-CoA dehydrogenase|nr:acyl-CoA dehydrogenase [Planctomycetota bacterium]MDP6838620.1 acyl-CoA dehydrogenase family protein [Planctomycetota bacterium]MDP6956607.1 acyl-CoA dehydrogenase family protein [Planctomycetota bacterium]
MDFDFSEEQEMVRAMAREFTDEAVRPLAESIEANHQVPGELLEQMAELGLMGIAIPEAYGGAGLGETGLCIVMEELTRGCFSTAATYGAHTSIGATSVEVGGSEEQKARFLPPMAAGEVLGAFALTESNAGSDPAAMATTAQRDGDQWVLNGEKIWITAGDIAGLTTVFAVTDREAGVKGLSAFVVPAGTPGFTVGKREEKMGQRGSSTVTLVLEDVRVPADHLLGAEGSGFAVAMKTLDRGRLAIGANCLGCGREALALSRAFAQEREAFGKPIAAQQAIQWMLADSATELYAIESMVYRAAWMCDAGRPFSRESAATKLFASEALDRIVDRGVQIHGGMGYSEECAISRLYRDARVTRIYEGTSEIQRLVLARDVLKNG